jgi:hypothetical protein
VTDVPPGDDVARDADGLPEDLDVTQYQGPYLFPDTNRRRIAGTIYVGLAVLCAIAAAVSGGNDGLNDGLVGAAVLLALIGGYHFLAAWPLHVDQTEALTVASRTVGFPVGHASGQLGFRGLRSRPSWRILLYSADEPPSMRGLVELDGVDGTVQGEYTELNPEDWSEYGLDEHAGPAPD